MEFLANNPFSLILALSGIVFLIASLIMRFKPPASINHLYGYRTPRSMKSQENWDYAQQRSAGLMLLSAFLMIGLSLLGMFIDQSKELVMLFASISLIVVFSAIPLIIVERELKRREKDQG